MDGDFEILEQLAVMLGFKVVHLPQTLAEAKVFHDVAEHEPILYRKDRGDAAHGPRPSCFAKVAASRVLRAANCSGESLAKGSPR